MDLFERLRMTEVTPIIYYCETVTFSRYADLISKEGKAYLKRQNKETPFTHYMVCKTFRLIFIAAQIMPDCVIVLEINQSQPNFQSKNITVNLSNSIYGREIKNITDNYPEVSLTFADGEKVSFASLFEFLSNADLVDGHINDLLQMTVVYVGQTEITDKYVRLDGHETYGEVADELLGKYPEYELFVKKLHFDQPAISDLEDAGLNFDDAKKNRIEKFLCTVTSKQWKTLVEAALIFNLKPEYNSHYKAKFPLPSHAYSVYFNSPFDSVVVVVNENLRPYATVFPDGSIVRTIETVNYFRK